MQRHYVLLIFILAVSQVIADDTNQPFDFSGSNAFIDEYFIQDSIAVMFSGTLYSAIIEAACTIVVLHPGQRADFCQRVAPEVTIVVYFFALQKAVDPMEIWEYLNMILLAAISGFNGGVRTEIAVRKTITVMVYYHVMKSSTNSILKYRSESSLEYQDTYIFVRVLTSGASTGLLLSGILLPYSGGFTNPVERVVRAALSSGLACTSTVFLSKFIDWGIQGIPNGVDIGLMTGVGAGFIALFVTEEELPALVGGIVSLLALNGVFNKANVETSAENVMIALNGLLAGVLITIVTGTTVSTLIECHSTNSITGHLTIVIASGLPLLVFSWLVSLNNFLEGNVTAYETMNAVHPWNVLEVILSGY